MVAHPHPVRRGRPAGLTPNRIRKRYIIAAAVTLGVKIAHVARQIRVSRPWASREANSPAVRALIADLIAARREHVTRVLRKALDAINEALGAEMVVRRSDGTLVTVPDHDVRLEAVQVFTRLLVALRSFRALRSTVAESRNSTETDIRSCRREDIRSSAVQRAAPCQRKHRC